MSALGGEIELIAQTLQKAQVDEQVDERVPVGDGGAVAQVRALDAAVQESRERVQAAIRKER